MKESPTAIYNALINATADPDTARILTYIAIMLTGGDTAYKGAGNAAGAWGVSPEVWGEIPSCLAKQALQAVRIYQNQIETLPWTVETLPERAVVSAMAWYHPTATRAAMPIGVDAGQVGHAEDIFNQIEVGTTGGSIVRYVVIAIVVVVLAVVVFKRKV